MIPFIISPLGIMSGGGGWPYGFIIVSVMISGVQGKPSTRSLDETSVILTSNFKFSRPPPHH